MDYDDDDDDETHVAMGNTFVNRAALLSLLSGF